MKKQIVGATQNLARFTWSCIGCWANTEKELRGLDQHRRTPPADGTARTSGRRAEELRRHTLSKSTADYV